MADCFKNYHIKNDFRLKHKLLPYDPFAQMLVGIEQ